jgi:hypothetical protein
LAGGTNGVKIAPHERADSFAISDVDEIWEFYCWFAGELMRFKMPGIVQS